MRSGKIMLRRADAVLAGASSLGAIISGLIIVFMMLSTAVDVFSRQVMDKSIPSIIESNAVGMIAVVFLALGHAQRTGKHVSMSLVARILPTRVAQVLHLSGMTAALAVVGWTVNETMLRAQQSLETSETTFGLVRIPLWPFRWMIVIGLVLFILELVRSMVVEPEGNLGEMGEVDATPVEGDARG